MLKNSEEMTKATIVSCYYALNKSKHSLQEYMRWIQNFLTYVDTPIVMFGEGEMLQIMTQMRESAGHGNNWRVIEKKFEDLEFSTKEWIERWEDQVGKSNFKHLHTQELFRVWANKSFFVKEVMETNPFDSEIFVWCDAGCWRDPLSAMICGPSWPVAEKVVPNRLSIVSISDVRPFLEKTKAFPSDQSFQNFVKELDTCFQAIIGGTILVGDKAAWKIWIPTFQATLLEFLEQGKFAGDDQAVISTAAFWLWKQNSPGKPMFLKSPGTHGFLQIADHQIGDAWFCFQQHFSRINFTLETY